MTVFAQWGVELIFNGNGAALDGDDPSNPHHYATRIVPEGEHVANAPGMIWPNDPEREGFIFRGWYTEANPSHESPLPPALGQPFNENTIVSLRTTIFARWEIRPAHLVTFDLQGGDLLSSAHSAYRLARQGMSINASAFPPHNLNIYPNVPPGHVGTALLWPRTAPGVTRTGMTIEGWWTHPNGPDGGGTRFAPMGANNTTASTGNLGFPAGWANTPVLGDITVYANWVYRVEFVPNDGTHFLNAHRWRDVPVHTYPNGTVASNGRIIVGGSGTPGMPIFPGSHPDTPHVPIREGYTFVGWYTHADRALGEPWDQNTPVTQSIRIYAHWEPNALMSVTFNLEGGGWPSGSTAPETVNLPHQATIASATGVTMPQIPRPPASGLIFGGWYSEPGGTGAVFDRLTPVTENRHVYAHWRPAGEVRLHSNGGIFAAQAIAGGNIPPVGTPQLITRTLPIGTTFGIHHTFWIRNEGPANRYSLAIFGNPYFTNPTRQGFTFRGWNTSSDGRGQMFDRTTVIDGDIDIFAVWTNTVTFNNNHNTPSPGMMNSTAVYVIASGWTVTTNHLHANMPDDQLVVPFPSMQNIDNIFPSLRHPYLAFRGWNTQPNGQGQRFTGNEIINGNITVYAVWDQSVAFNSGAAPPEVILPENEVRIPSALGYPLGDMMPPDPEVWDGHVFRGWNTRPDGTGSTFGPSVIVYGVLEVYAIWGATVTFDTAGGAMTPPDPYHATAEINRPLGAAYPTNQPTRNGWIFAGWFGNVGTDSHPFITQFTQSGPAIQRSMTLTAHWINDGYPEPPVEPYPEPEPEPRPPSPPVITEPGPSNPGNIGGGTATGAPRRPTSSRPDSSGRPGHTLGNFNEGFAETGQGGFTMVEVPPDDMNDTLIDEIAQSLQYQDIIRIPINHYAIYRGDGVHWVETAMDTTAFIAEDGSIMIPIRFLTYSLRYPVLWDTESLTATLNPGDHQIQITAGSTVMDGAGDVSIPITNRFGAAVPAYLRLDHDRILLPMHALGTAFNIEYRWDREAQEAIFYPLRPLSR
ncbi:MAG: InlB B-repeat-containing protein, partial [Defluviitaleaceae bacterium]|nr:InlB B-repeat-containing protein [Defluviitaleaceae bacterium]